MRRDRRKEKAEPQSIHRDQTRKMGKADKWVFIATLAAVVVAFFAILTWDLHRQRVVSQAEHAAADRLPYAGHPMLGQADAPVVIAEFADFKCTTCRYWHAHILPKLVHDEIDPGKARLYFFPFPVINKDSITAAEAAYSVYKHNPAAFWRYCDAIFRHQQAEDKLWATPAYLVSLIQQEVPGVAAGQVRQDLAEHRFRSLVKADVAAGMQAGVQFTPTVFVNGQMVANPLDVHQIESMIQAAIR